MTKMRRIQIDDAISVEDAWQELEAVGITVAYSEEDQGHQCIHIFHVEEILLPSLDWIKTIEDYTLPETDWNSQWEIHGMDFKDGFVHVDLSQFGTYSSILKLEPGPGFGDLSHSTTRLVLKLMAKYLKNQVVIDVGSGSGILTLAAIKMGSHEAYGIDIDGAAVKHAQNNAKINELEHKCTFQIATEFKTGNCPNEKLICMNMIMCEQEVAWQSMRSLHKISAKILTSGLLAEDRETYLQKTKKCGWQLLEEIVEDGWLGFCFQQVPS